MNLEMGIATLEIVDQKKRRFSGTFTIPSKSPEPDEMDSDSSSETNESSSPGTSTATIALRRSSRKRIHTDDTRNRRVKMKPKKFCVDSDSLDDVRSYYLDKTVKRLPPALETIYEEPQQINNEIAFMSTRRYRRSLNLKCNGKVTKNSAKSKKRRLKAKAIGAPKRGTKKITIDYVVKYLQELKDD